MIKFSAIVLMVVFLSACNQEDRIIGTWIRIGNYQPGLTVKVTKYSDKLSGEVIKPALNDTTFIIGDIKWKNITKVGENRYEFGNLQKWDWEFGSIYKNGYEDSYFTLENDTLRMRYFSKEANKEGQEQIWLKINE